MAHIFSVWHFDRHVSVISADISRKQRPQAPVMGGRCKMMMMTKHHWSTLSCCQGRRQPANSSPTHPLQPNTRVQAPGAGAAARGRRLRSTHSSRTRKCSQQNLDIGIAVRPGRRQHTPRESQTSCSLDYTGRKHNHPSESILSATAKHSMSVFCSQIRRQESVTQSCKGNTLSHQPILGKARSGGHHLGGRFACALIRSSIGAQGLH